MQQNPQPSLLPTILLGLTAVVNFLAIPATAIIGYLIGRRKQSADISQVNADTHKTEAETRQIDSQIALKAFERLDDLESIIDDLRHERRDDKKTIADWEWKYGLQEVQLRKAAATLKDNNITWNEKA